jgi:hypothetical protein
VLDAIKQFLYVVIPMLVLAALIGVPVWLFVRPSKSKPPPASARICPKCYGDPNWVWHTSQGPMRCPRCGGKGWIR